MDQETATDKDFYDPFYAAGETGPYGTSYDDRFRDRFTLTAAAIGCFAMAALAVYGVAIGSLKEALACLVAASLLGCLNLAVRLRRAERLLEVTHAKVIAQIKTVCGLDCMTGGCRRPDETPDEGHGER